MLKIGEQAPPFEATDQQGQPVRLSQFAGRTILLWFTPHVPSG